MPKICKDSPDNSEDLKEMWPEPFHGYNFNTLGFNFPEGLIIFHASFMNMPLEIRKYLNLSSNGRIQYSQAIDSNPYITFGKDSVAIDIPDHHEEINTLFDDCIELSEGWQCALETLIEHNVDFLVFSNHGSITSFFEDCNE